MRYYLIAGEVSGDLHTARLMQALQVEDKAACFRYIGGVRMQAAAPEGLFMDIKELAVMGTWEVLKKIWTLKTYLKQTCGDILKFEPDCVILIDFAGFNLRVAKFAKEHGIEVIYYISPKIWAWNEGRIHKIKRYVDQMYVILPFEPPFYQKYNFPVHYFGNPLLDSVASFQKSTTPLPSSSDRKIIALLPGSRRQELKHMLRIMLSVIPYFGADYEFVIAGLKHLPATCYAEAEAAAVRIIWDDSYALLQQAHIALVTSGTATLETAIFKVPQVVCYKSNLLTYCLGKLFIKVPYISLINLIANKPIVKELIQFNCTPENLRVAVLDLIENYDRAVADYDSALKDLGTPSIAGKIAKSIFESLKIEI